MRPTRAMLNARLASRRQSGERIAVSVAIWIAGRVVLIANVLREARFALLAVVDLPFAPMRRSYT